MYWNMKERKKEGELRQSAVISRWTARLQRAGTYSFLCDHMHV